MLINDAARFEKIVLVEKILLVISEDFHKGVTVDANQNFCCVAITREISSTQLTSVLSCYHGIEL